MKRLRGLRFFLYAFSTAGYGLILVSLTAGGAAFFSPPLERLKDGLPRFLPALPPDNIRSLWFAALLGLLAFAVVSPLAAFQAGRSRTALGGRRAFLLAGLPLLALSSLLVFLPFAAGPAAVNLVLVFLFSLAAGAGAAVSFAPYLSLGYSSLPVDADRASLAALQTALLFAGALLPVALLPGFFTMFPGLDPTASFQWSVFLLILPAAVIVSVAFFTVREKPAKDSSRRHDASFPAAAARALRTAASHRAFSRFLRAEACVSFALAALAASLYFVGRDLMLVDAEFTRLSVVAFLAAGLIFPPFLRPLAAKLDKRKLGVAGSAALAAGLLVLAATGFAPDESGLRWNCAVSAAQAPDGGVWIGTKRGASRFAAGAWSQVTRREGLIDDRINSISAGDGGVWFATEGGASFFDGAAWTHYSKASGLIDNRVIAVMQRGGAVWFLTPVGVSLLDRENSRWVEFAPKRPGGKDPAAPLTAFGLSPEGDLWVGTERGAYRLSGSDWTEYTTGKGLKDDTITSLEIGEDGVVFLGTYRGVARLSGTAWTYLTSADGLPSDAVRAIRTAPDGRLFVATDSGCFISGPAGKRVLTRADGLAADKVEDVLFARNGSTWFVTASGVTELAQGRVTTYRYPLPWIWGLAALILLAFPIALLLALSLLFTADAAATARDKTNERRDPMFFAAALSAKAGGFIAALIVAMCLLYGGAESIANPLPVRILLMLASLASIAGLMFQARGQDRGKKRK
ncbi:MAG: MFS transporter [Spirochaetales bacterium]|nr:MFS transporter [Spirochaetales bacterium]